MRHVNLEDMIEQNMLERWPECKNCLHPHKSHIPTFVQDNHITGHGHYELRCPFKHIIGYCYASD